MTDDHPLIATWRHAVQAAIVLDPPRIRTAIEATAYDGLRAGAGSGRSSGPSDPTALAAISAASVQRDRELADLERVDAAERDWVLAVGIITSLCHSAEPPADWDEACMDANLVLEAGYLTDAIRVKLPVTGAVDGGARAVERMELLARHVPHAPSRHDQLHAERHCLSHARIGDYERPVVGQLRVCKTCYDLIAETGPVPQLHKDPDAWPATSVLEAHAGMERTGKRTEYLRARTDWLNSRPRRQQSA